MKRLFTQWTAIALGCFVMGFSSCSSDDGDDATPSIPDGPKITFTAPGLTVTDGAIDVDVTKDSTLIVKYSVEAAGKITKLEQTVDGTSETVAAANDKTSYSKDVILNLPFEDKSIVIEVEVTDENDKSATAKVTVNVGAIVPPSRALTEAVRITMGGPASPADFSRWDLDVPAGFGGWSLASGGANADQVPNMDSFYKTQSLNNTDTESDRFADTDCRFVITEFTKAEFDAMENDELLKDLVIDQTYLQHIEVGQVVAFKTNLGRIGLLYFDQYTQDGDDADFIHKIQALEE